MITGYTSGVFDLFHIGHLNILKNAKSVCDKLIVGVTTDEFCIKYKNKKPTIPFNNRFEIVESIKYSDLVIPQKNHNKMDIWEKHKFNIMICGNDWEGTDKWNIYEKQFADLGVKIIYFPRTIGISSTKILEIINK